MKSSTAPASSRSDLNAALRSIDARVPRLSARLRARLIKSGLALTSDAEDFLSSQLLSVMLDSSAIARRLSRDSLAMAHDPKAAVKSMFEAIAKSSAIKSLAKIQDKLTASIASGPKGLKKRVLEVVDKSSPAAIIKTSVTTLSSLAYNASVWQEDEDDEDLWGYELVVIDDEATRLAHWNMRGARYPKNHKFWETAFPPNGWNCRCGARAIYKGDPDASLKPMKGKPEVDPEFAFNPGKMFAM